MRRVNAALVLFVYALDKVGEYRLEFDAVPVTVVVNGILYTLYGVICGNGSGSVGILAGKQCADKRRSVNVACAVAVL